MAEDVRDAGGTPSGPGWCVWRRRVPPSSCCSPRTVCPRSCTGVPTSARAGRTSRPSSARPAPSSRRTASTRASASPCCPSPGPGGRARRDSRGTARARAGRRGSARSGSTSTSVGTAARSSSRRTTRTRAAPRAGAGDAALRAAPPPRPRHQRRRPALRARGPAARPARPHDGGRAPRPRRSLGQERVPQRSAFVVGSHVREGRHGRTGADAATVLVAGEPGFGFDAGETWGPRGLQRQPRRLRRADLRRASAPPRGRAAAPRRGRARPGGVVHGPLALREPRGRSRRARRAVPRPPPRTTRPPAHPATGRHERVGGRVLRPRPRPPQGARRPRRRGGDRAVRPRRRLVRRASGRRHGPRRLDRVRRRLGRRALRRPRPARQAARDGVRPLVRARDGNLDSDLARRHPEWILQVEGRLPVEARHQQVLDLSHPGAYEHVLEHRRDRPRARCRLRQVGPQPRPRRRGLDAHRSCRGPRADPRDVPPPGRGPRTVPGARDRVLLVRRSARRPRDPRADRPGLGVGLHRRPRAAADPALDGAAPPARAGRQPRGGRPGAHDRAPARLSFRAATALFGHFGIEWDLSEATEAERRELADWVEHYKQVRHLVHTGRVVRRSLEGETCGCTAP